MKNKLSFSGLILSLLLLQGCAGGLIVVAGATVAVVSDERSISTQINDDNLALDALDKMKELDINHQEVRINFISNNGYLLIIGQVKNEAQGKMIERELSKLKGVTEVYNQLRVGKLIGLSQKSQDSWITMKTKSQLTTHEEVDSLKVKVVTENAEVFLIGSVDNKTADAATDVARKISGVKRVNRVFQIVPDK